ncbi:FecCD family ABC transporter permease [Salidesulfovibrio onnuriiensis]|uniref:FecCD family ABC transporter permease n=1 Tax=Salidesulfovibrio onnuriiensis TaxID=2583823 RepID=UPI0011C71E0E|nr:iron ABC transporter permease [Salidesulfovibrio onnuriiensis]
MHFDDGVLPADYLRHVNRKRTIIAGTGLVLAAALVVAISCGAVNIPLAEVWLALTGSAASKRWDAIIWNIRLPQALAAIVAGAGLAVAGVVMQSVLRNPLGSPFTLGITHAASFGAALSVMVLDSGSMHSTGTDAIVINNPYVTTSVAFAMSLVATLTIIAISRIRRSSPETTVLAGVALWALFTAGTMFLQYFADDVQLAAMVFWTFGDTARANWPELAVMGSVTGAGCVYFICNRWNYNAINAGDETAKGLGVQVERVRILGMFVSSLLTAVIVSFVGIIGFVGLVCPHMVRRFVGDDHRFLIPASILFGGVLLLASDTVARLLLAPHILPVSVLTAFLGAPAFLYLITRRNS